MADRADAQPAETDASVSTRTYAAVLIVEVVVLLALWVAGRYFGTP
jgi:hypothetical protein